MLQGGGNFIPLAVVSRSSWSICLFIMRAAALLTPIARRNSTIAYGATGAASCKITLKASGVLRDSSNFVGLLDSKETNTTNINWRQCFL